MSYAGPRPRRLRPVDLNGKPLWPAGATPRGKRVPDETYRYYRDKKESRR